MQSSIIATQQSISIKPLNQSPIKQVEIWHKENSQLNYMTQKLKKINKNKKLSFKTENLEEKYKI